MATQAVYSWVPSSARYVEITGFGPTPRGAGLMCTAQLSWPPKDPAETLDYVFDITDALFGNEGDAIATLDIGIAPSNPGDLTLQSASADGGRAILWLTGGQAGTSYAVTVTLGTNSGRILSRTIYLLVTNLAAANGTENAITDQTGAPITTQSGAAITTS